MDGDGDGWEIVTRQQRQKPPASANTEDCQDQARTQNHAKHQHRRSAHPSRSYKSSPVTAELPIIELPPPHPSDQVFAKARSLVILHNCSTFARFVNPLRVYNMEVAPTVYTNDISNIVHMALVFQKNGIRIKGRLPRRSSKGRTGRTLMCEIKGEWYDFEAWLAGLKEPSGAAAIGEKGINLQQQWWERNGKAFRLLDLPPELRVAVLEQAVGAVLYPNISRSGNLWRVNCGLGSEVPRYHDSDGSLTYDYTKHAISRPNLDFIFANRQLYEEVKAHLHYGTTKAFDTAKDLELYTHCLTGSPGGMKHLRHVTLDFSHREYLLFFNVQVPPFNTNWDTLDYYGVRKGGLSLQQVPHLKSLELHFRSTISLAVDSPWQYTGNYNGHQDYCDFAGRRDRQGFVTPCQRVFVDWVLTFAKQYIQHTPQILLTGYIKDSTREKWDAIFKDEKAGSSYDESTDKLNITNWPLHDIPPRCHCTKRCSFGTYYTILHTWECRDRRCDCRPYSEKDEDEMLKQYKFDFKD